MDIRAELSSNKSQFLDKSYPNLAATIPDNFPDLAIVQLYLHPITSWSSGMKVEPFDWKPREPNIAVILDFCEERLSWKRESSLVRLHKNLFEGVVIRMLALVCVS